METGPQEDSGNLKLEGILKLAKTLAILATGCWVLFQYITYQRASNSISLDQQKLSVKQADLALQAETLKQSFTISEQQLTQQQQKLANEQAALNLQTERADADLKRKELEAAVLSKQADVALARLKQRQEAVEANFKDRSRFNTHLRLKARSGGSTGLYIVTVGLDSENLSEVPVDISLILLDFYVGSMTTGNGAVIKKSLVESFEDFPNRWNVGSRELTAVDWQRAGSWASRAAGSLGDLNNWGFVLSDVERVLSGGPGTGRLQQGEAIPFGHDFVITSVPEHGYLGVIANVCLNECKDSASDLLWASETLNVDDIEKVGEVTKSEAKSSSPQLP